MDNQIPDTGNPVTSFISDVLPHKTIKSLNETHTLTDEMIFIDSIQALNRVCAHDKWLQSSGAKPLDGYPKPHAIQIEFTQRCNLSCEFCYNDSGPHNTSELNLSVLDRICTEIIEMGVGEVIISGGEPLLKPKHLKLVLNRIGSKDIPIHILTNGLLINSDWLNLFNKAGVTTIQVSLDGGDSQIHDRIRGQKGAWKKAIKGLAMAHGAGLHTFVSTVLTRENVKSLPALIEACYICGCNNLNVGDLITSGRGNQFIGGDINAGKACTNDEFDWAAEFLIQQHNLYKNKMTVRLAVNMYMFVCQLKIKGLESMLIRGDGSVRPHCTLSDIVAGSIYEESLHDIWRKNLSQIHTKPIIQEILNDHVTVSTAKLKQLRCYKAKS